MKDAHGNAGAIERLTTEEAVIAHIVYGKDDGYISHERIVAIGCAQQHRDERGLPIVAVDYVGLPDVLGDFNRGAAKLAVAFGIVRIIAPCSAIEPVAIKIGGIVYKKIANALITEPSATDGKRRRVPPMGIVTLGITTELVFVPR